MYAIIQLGAFQYKVSEGDLLNVQRLSSGENGKNITIDKVLLCDDGQNVHVGRPILSNVKVTAEVIGQVLDDKVVAFKYRRRKNSYRKRGHRQKLMTVNIKSISVL